MREHAGGARVVDKVVSQPRARGNGTREDAEARLGELFVTADMVGMQVRDQDGFDLAMSEQRARAQASWKGAAKQTANPVYQQLPHSTFEGYRQTESSNCEVLALIRNGQGAHELKKGEQGEVILDHTPFYAESGGQVADRGLLYSPGRTMVVAEVEGPAAALALVDSLALGDLSGYHLFHAIRADLLRRLGRDAEAALAYEAAIARTENAAERDFLQRRRQALTRA